MENRGAFVRSPSPSRFRTAAFVGDAAVACLALGLAFWIRTRVSIPGTETLLPLEKVQFTARNVLLVAAAQVLALSLFGLYGARERFRDPLGRLLIPALFFELFALSTVYFLAFAQAYAFPRSVLVLYLLVDGVLLAIWRTGLGRLFPQPRRRAILVGAGPAVVLIAEAIRRHPWSGVDLVGLLSESESPISDLERVGSIADLASACVRLSIDEIIVTPEETNWRDRIGEAIPRRGRSGASRLAVPLRNDDRAPAVSDRGRPSAARGEAAAARGAPRGVQTGVRHRRAAVLLVPGLPIVLLASIAVEASSRGGAFYRQARVGKDGRVFSLWKLRTMRAGAETETGAVLASPGDPRVTPVGRLLRVLRLDEIPQLWNVLRGDMSLVGPRPERPEFADRLAVDVAGYSLRHAARPGLTGLAQISGDYATEPEIKLRYDLAYLNNWSFGLDLSILLRTVPVILTRRGV